MLLKKVSWIQILALLGAVGVPFFSILFFSYSSKEKFQWFFLFFIIAHSLERVWETFYTSKERRPFELHGDWTLIATTAAYIILCLLSSAESLLFWKRYSLAIGFLGIFLYVISFRLRWWGMKSLGKQWAVHAIGAQKVSKVRVVKVGPYKYIRHPIYLAIFLEVLSIPLIANSLIGFLFAAFFYIPLQYKRLLEEEKNNVRKMGEPYLAYMNETSAIFPTKRLFCKKVAHNK
jgi:protein-S-isoprenylcysteine O-methyltransferase Ste14